MKHDYITPSMEVLDLHGTWNLMEVSVYLSDEEEVEEGYAPSFQNGLDDLEQDEMNRESPK